MRACEEVGELPHLVGIASLGWRRWALVGVEHGPAGRSARSNLDSASRSLGAHGWPGTLGIEGIHPGRDSQEKRISSQICEDIAKIILSNITRILVF